MSEVDTQTPESGSGVRHWGIPARSLSGGSDVDGLDGLVLE